MMNVEKKMKNADSTEMFGFPASKADDYIAGVKDSIGGPGMAAMSVMSDAQMWIEFGELEQARQYINRAKLIVSELLTAQTE